MNTSTLKSTDIDQLARKRASAKMGWYIHASVYIVVNLLLAALSAMNDRHCAAFPAIGWGIGLGYMVPWCFSPPAVRVCRSDWCSRSGTSSPPSATRGEPSNTPVVF